MMNGERLIEFLVENGFIVRRKKQKHAVIQKKGTFFTVPLFELNIDTITRILSHTGIPVSEALKRCE